MLKNCCVTPKPEKLKLPKAHMERQCGECTACCSVMAVAEIDNKPFFEKCKHVCPTGCSIYKLRPESCANWECGWRSGWITGGDSLRPDNLGVMFEWRMVGVPATALLIVYEVWPDALKLPKVQSVLNRLKNEGEAIVEVAYGLHDGKMTVTGDEAIFELALDFTTGKPILPEVRVRDEHSGGVHMAKTTRLRNGGGFHIEILDPTAWKTVRSDE